MGEADGSAANVTAFVGDAAVETTSVIPPMVTFFSEAGGGLLLAGADGCGGTGLGELLVLEAFGGEVARGAEGTVEVKEGDGEGEGSGTGVDCCKGEEVGVVGGTLAVGIGGGARLGAGELAGDFPTAVGARGNCTWFETGGLVTGGKGGVGGDGGDGGDGGSAGEAGVTRAVDGVGEGGIGFVVDKGLGSGSGEAGDCASVEMGSGWESAVKLGTGAGPRRWAAPFSPWARGTLGEVGPLLGEGTVVLVLGFEEELGGGVAWATGGVAGADKVPDLGFVSVVEVEEP